MSEQSSRTRLARRALLKAGAALGGAAAVGCHEQSAGGDRVAAARQPAVASSLVLSEAPLGSLWPTFDPFLFCAYHRDDYPAGNEQLGPAESLAGRRLGNDFTSRDGYRMYHGRVVPGFPQHPHRGFETVTVARRGLVDHADSLGATARYGNGDVQWMTAGRGIVHAEMFPLIERVGPNPLELFQIWLNLPAASKMVPPHFTMFWSETIARHRKRDNAGAETAVTVIAGSLGAARGPAPPPNSWAARASSDVAIWTLKMQAKARFELPPAKPGTDRTLYFFRGDQLQVAERPYTQHRALRLAGDQPVPLKAGADGCEMLLLQGRPIGEAVARRGPFVMNSQAQIQQAYRDYRSTGFGGWPWPSRAPVHRPDAGRFAKYLDGRIERAG